MQTIPHRRENSRPPCHPKKRKKSPLSYLCECGVFFSLLLSSAYLVNLLFGANLKEMPPLSVIQLPSLTQAASTLVAEEVKGDFYIQLHTPD